ncbi:MAG TPA: S1 RNA-binding domain-containing protein [Candidatus Faeciplasma pullistercoris]|uniref:S1 RNA-binding domain-containing protein n=1 Tax=Candidatus Faeciplasma pullistercoris TaxID=2840800 RepID=A0A9D1GSC7_9FIRM|nr:S1 RNA-binding domain-containing protein [Candidatus Faeciplasma pullistercoris]
MQLEKDSVIEGKVTGILKFGAFVDLGEGKSGMVHISEISNSYVDDINKFLKVGQTVKVRVLSIAEDGKIALSIKKAEPPAQRENKPKKEGGFRQDDRAAFQRQSDKDSAPVQRHFSPKKPAKKEPVNIEELQYAYEPRTVAVNAGFEDMLSKFKASSEDRMSDLKRSMDIKKRGSRRK